MNVKFLTQYCSGDQKEKNAIGGAYSTHVGGEGEVFTEFSGKIWGKEATWKTHA